MSTSQVQPEAGMPSLWRSAAYNYAFHLGRYVVPLISIPYLSRTLGPAAYGQVLVVMTFATMLGLVVEYGFSLSATREFARNRTSRDATVDILSSVLGAKIMLAAIAVAVGIGAIATLPVLHHDWRLASVGLVLAIINGMSPMWYFQAIEKMRTQSAFDLAMQLAAVGAILWLVRSPADGLMLLVIYTAAAGMANILGYASMYASNRYRAPSLRAGIDFVRRGWTMFVFRSMVTLYTSANILLVGAILSPLQAGYFGAADKLFTVLAGLFGPFAGTLFPRMNYLMKSDPKAAFQLAKRGLALSFAVSAAAAVAIYFMAPLLVRILFGAEFAASVTPLRILACSLPFLAVSHVLGVQVMLPMGMDRRFNGITLITGLISFLACVALLSVTGINGMAAIRLLAEALAAGLMAWYLWSTRAQIAALISGDERRRD